MISRPGNDGVKLSIRLFAGFLFGLMRFPFALPESRPLHQEQPITESDKRMKCYGSGGTIAVGRPPGKAVDFPGWMEPFVNPFFGEGERITIAVNVLITGGKHAGLTRHGQIGLPGLDPR